MSQEQGLFVSMLGDCLIQHRLSVYNDDQFLKIVDLLREHREPRVRYPYRGGFTSFRRWRWPRLGAQCHLVSKEQLSIRSSSGTTCASRLCKSTQGK